MNQQQLVQVKLALVGLIIVGGIVLSALGKMDAASMFSQVTTAVSALLIALGIAGAGSAAGQAITTSAHMRMAAMSDERTKS